jgi:hypothetical protein
MTQVIRLKVPYIKKNHKKQSLANQMLKDGIEKNTVHKKI